MSWEPGVRIIMERNPDYFGEKPAFERLEYTIIKDQVAWPRMLKTRELDITRLQPEQYRTEVLQAKGPTSASPDIKFTQYPESSYFFIAWNEDRPWFKDPLVRRAMTLALDRPTILHNVFYDLGVLTSGPFPQQSPCYDKSIQAVALRSLGRGCAARSGGLDRLGRRRDPRQGHRRREGSVRIDSSSSTGARPSGTRSRTSTARR